MRLSLVFELLLIFVLLAFAASRVIDSKSLRSRRRPVVRKSQKVGHKTRQDVNKYCNCSTKLCNCCREFNIPLVTFQGPGCATLQYLQGDRLAISMSFGERILTNTTISGRKPQPVCMPLPGGVSKFCGRVYNIGREGEDFKACLGLELRALQDIEAALRVSCFRFGPKGLKVEPAQPLPVVENSETDNYDEEDDDDDDDDDDDEYGFDDDDDDYGLDNDVDSGDYTAFSVFDDEIVGDYFGDDDDDDDTDDVVEVVTNKTPVRRVTRKPTRSTSKVVRKPTKRVTTSRPLTAKSTAPPKQILTSTTTSHTIMIPVATITTAKKPEVLDVSFNSVDMPISAETVASSPHESIAPVTAMLQSSPAGTSHMTSMDAKPEKLVPSSTSSESSMAVFITKPLISESTPGMEKEVATQQQPTPFSLMSTMQETINTATEPSHKYESTTATDKTWTTNMVTDVTEEAEEENSSTEAASNLILKNDDDDDNILEDDEDEEEDDGEGITDPISTVVEEVLGDDDDSEEKTKTDKEISKKPEKKNNNKKESSDVIDDIVNGVVETITGEDADDSEQETTATSVTTVKQNNDDDDDVDDDEDDEDAEDDDEEEDEQDLLEDDDNESNEDENEDEARKMNLYSNTLRRNRRSSDIW